MICFRLNTTTARKKCSAFSGLGFASAIGLRGTHHAIVTQGYVSLLDESAYQKSSEVASKLSLANER